MSRIEQADLSQGAQAARAEEAAGASATAGADASRENTASASAGQEDAAGAVPVRVAVIGYGTAGVNALIALRRAGYAGDVHVFSDATTLPYSPILTSYYAGGEKAYEECFPWSADELACLGAEVHLDCPVTALDPTAHLIRTPQGDFTYEKCLIASGAHPSTAGFPATEGYEPLVLRTLDDACRLKRVLEGGACRRVLVSGASMVALKSLEACLRHDVTCTLVGMNPHVLDFNALPAAAERFERGLAAKGVELRLGQTIKSVEVASAEDTRDAVANDASTANASSCSVDTADANGMNTGAAAAAISGTAAPGKLTVTFSTGEADRFDEVIVAHGVRSNLGFLPQGALEADRALLVDEFMRTSDPDVYAAGDVAQALELVSGERRVVGIWKSAALQGACAGAAMAAELAGGAPEAADAYPGSIPTNTIAVLGTLFISAGSVEACEGRRVEVREDDDMTVVYVYEDADDGGERLVGFNVTCDEDVAGSRAYDTGAMLTLRIEAACR
ncbi:MULTISPECIES: NAD(P)/FAD-dependent oxidoreductase [unclassified Adlercreutzia]|uniref:NAD(P)/FAD-dependent oxidoreductase n=1 Tax=unclassified Adlercreutzia TaxID=2636013 RepID=UPI0013EC75C2|nr:MULTISPECIES: FAD/NAD(P)-binding oxidoreductase [unclassified Adlercreutzia]